MSHEALKAFANQAYLNLETFRRNNQAVQTPVWFVEYEGQLYVRTMGNSGKVKRIRNNSRVRVVPCEVRGNPKGEWVNANARVLDPGEANKINQVVTQKYGFQKRIFDLMNWIRGTQWKVIGISLD
jgi:uncharacterized protein